MRKFSHNDKCKISFGPSARVACVLVMKSSILIEKCRKVLRKRIFLVHSCSDVSSSVNSMKKSLKKCRFKTILFQLTCSTMLNLKNPLYSQRSQSKFRSFKWTRLICLSKLCLFATSKPHIAQISLVSSLWFLR